MLNEGKLAAFWVLIEAFASHTGNDPEFKAANENCKSTKGQVTMYSVALGIIHKWGLMHGHLIAFQLSQTDLYNQLTEFGALTGVQPGLFKGIKHFGRPSSGGWQKFTLLHPPKTFKSHCGGLLLAKERAEAQSQPVCLTVADVVSCCDSSCAA